MSTCAHCGTENRPTYTHCLACGRELVLQARTLPTPPTPPTPEQPLPTRPPLVARPPLAAAPASAFPVDPAAAVRGPAIALMCLSPILMLQSSLTMLVGGINMVEEGLDGAGMFTLVYLGLTLMLAIVIFFGANSMRKLGNYHLAWVAVILSMVPCFTFYCFMPGIAFGIWSISVLNKPEVKAAFGR